MVEVSVWFSFGFRLDDFRIHGGRPGHLGMSDQVWPLFEQPDPFTETSPEIAPETADGRSDPVTVAEPPWPSLTVIVAPEL